MPITPADFIIRPFQGSETDLLAILEVYRQCEDFLSLGPVPVASMEMVQADLKISEKEGGSFCLICSAQTGEVWGIVDYVLAGFSGDPRLADLSLLMIAAPHRGKGLGAAVVQWVEAEIRRDGRARAIDSGVQVNNADAIRFWQRMGYQIVSGATPMPDGTVVYRLWKAV